jgi:hypothetical protein
VLSGRGLCDELITRPEESYRLWCVVVCDLETSSMGAPYIYMTLVTYGLIRSACLRVRTPLPKTERKNTFYSIANFFLFFFVLNIRYGGEQVRCRQRLPIKGTASWERYFFFFKFLSSLYVRRPWTFISGVTCSWIISHGRKLLKTNIFNC